MISLEDWKAATKIRMTDPPFYALLTALILSTKTNTNDLALLHFAFPREVAEAKARYNAPGGCLTIQEWKTEYGDRSPLLDTDLIEKHIAQAKEKAGVTW